MGCLCSFFYDLVFLCLACYGSQSEAAVYFIHCGWGSGADGGSRSAKCVAIDVVLISLSAATGRPMRRLLF